jgi:hypothetical protein
MSRRQCTAEFKIQPIQRKVRELLGLHKGQRGPKEIAAHQLIGISTDEMVRMKNSTIPYIQNRWPLIELGMSRRDCLAWMERHGYRMPSKSSCTFCPYHDDAMWRDIRDNDPASWAQAIEVDAHLRSGNSRAAEGMRGQLYVHRSCVPLDQVDLRTAADFGQISFLDECDGMCGV